MLPVGRSSVSIVDSLVTESTAMLSEGVAGEDFSTSMIILSSVTVDRVFTLDIHRRSAILLPGKREPKTNSKKAKGKNS